jgi:cytochrome c556
LQEKTMRNKIPMSIIAIASLIFLSGLIPATAQQPVAEAGDIQLSPQLRELLRTEMREIASGTQILSLALASADWKTVASTSAKIRTSYILEKKLSAAQRHELERALPPGFKELDGEFHARAEKLGAAAAAHDSELAAFHFYRMVESCASCHASYAKSRFPGFSPEKPAAHRH